MKNANRREFLKTSATLAGASAIATPAIAARTGGANDRVRIGLLGMGGRMAAHVRALAQMADQNVEIVAICDCDQSKLDAAAKRYPELKDKKLTVYSDMRAMFDDDSIDAVSNALGDRWHSLSTIWACQAGKDVYVEKPGSHNLFECRQMVAAARKYDRMVQHGTQNRSSPNIVEGIEKLKEGVIGDVYMARAVDFKIRGNLGKISDQPAPSGLDWDQWLGPRPMHAYSNFWHRRWHYNLELSSGSFANQLIHQMDIIRWGLGLQRHPTHVASVGGKYVHDDDRTTPTDATMTFRFGPSSPMVTCETRSWYTNGEAGFRDKYPFVQPKFPVGTMFLGSKGYLILPDYSSYYTFLGPNNEPGPSKAEEGHPMADLPHFQNWIDAIRTRDHKLLNADIHEGYMSMTMALLARTSYEVGRQIEFDPQQETVVGDDEANRLLNEPEFREPYVVPKQV